MSTHSLPANGALLVFDFDQTLFDTRSMKVYLGEERIRRIIAGMEFLSPNELRQFVYPDVWEFLDTDHTPRILLSVVAPTTKTPTSLSFQRAKIAASGIVRYFPIQQISGERFKGSLLERFCTANGIPSRNVVFVDDMQNQIDSVQECCPGARTILIDRSRPYGNERDIIASFAELPKLLGRTPVVLSA